MSNEIVLVALIGLAATVISGAIGSMGQPWVTARIARDKEQREADGLRRDRERAQCAELANAMGDVLAQMERARALTPAAEPQAVARSAAMRYSGLWPLLADTELRTRCAAFDALIRPAVFDHTRSHPSDEMRAAFDAVMNRIGAVIRG